MVTSRREAKRPALSSVESPWEGQSPPQNCGLVGEPQKQGCSGAGTRWNAVPANIYPAQKLAEQIVRIASDANVTSPVNPVK